MILPVTFGAGPSAAQARHHPEEAAQRPDSMGKPGSGAAVGGDSRVNISPAGAQLAQAEAKTTAGAPVPQAPNAPNVAQAPTPAAAESALDLAFAAADSNRDGTVTISEQQNYEVRTVRISIRQPADGRLGPAGSGPLRAYLEVGSTIAGS
jgi:hypothetical protein